MRDNGEPVWIEDGYTKEGYIARVPGLHGDVSFTFRAMISPERARVQRNIDKAKSPEEGEAIVAECIAARVTEWDVAKPNGQSLVITAKNIIRLNPTVFAKMFAQVLGLVGPDARPELENVDDLETADELQEEIDAKN